MRETHDADEARIYRRTIAAITAIVVAIGFGETAYGLAVDSRYLIRDGLEWSYDVVIYAIAAVAFGRGERAERLAAYALALVLLFAGVVAIWQVWLAFIEPPEVDPVGNLVASLLVIAETWAVVGLLWRFRAARHPVIEATWLSARNDAVTSTLYALVMMAARSMPLTGPQMIVDAISAILCLQAGARILRELTRGKDADLEGART